MAVFSFVWNIKGQTDLWSATLNSYVIVIFANRGEFVMGRKKEYVLLFVLSIIFLAVGRYLFRIWEEYHEAEEGYQKLHQYLTENVDQDETEEERSQTADSKGKKKTVRTIDFDGLQVINEDIVA